MLASVLNEDAPDTSRDLIDALSRAEAIADSLADEREVAANPQELRTLQERLEQLKARVEAPLREYQATLALRAVDATLKGIDEGRHEIGYVCQSVGSGLSLTVDAYVTLLSQQLPLADWAVLIVADRSASTQQLYYRLEHLDRKGSCPVRAPGSKGFSESVRAAGTINIITIQGLMQALARDPVQKNVLLIGYDFDVIDHAVRKLLPQAHVISFLHHLVRVRPGSEPPVPIIGSYSLPEAIKDGYATPVNLLQRILPRADELDWLDPGLDEWLTVDEIDVLQPRGFRWTEAGMKLLASDIVAHFSERQQIFAGKALVVFDSIETANALCHELQRAVIHEQLGDASYVAVLSSTLSDEETRTLIWNFCREGAQPHIVVSAKRWTGIDVPLLHCAYVTCPLSRGALLNVIGRLASLHSDKASATLVDYASNKFFHLEGFALGQATLP